MRLKTFYPVVVLGSISGLNWSLYARAFEREGIPAIGLQSAVAFLAPFSAFLALAAIYAYFQEKSGNKISFEEAVFHVSLASTPIAVNGVALLIRGYFTSNWTEYILSPFAALLMAGVMAYEAIGSGVVAPEGEYLPTAMRLLVNYGAAWLAFFMLYAYLAKTGKTRLVFFALVFLYIIALAGHYLIVAGISVLLLLLYKVKKIRTGVRAKILAHLEENHGIHFRGLAKTLDINRGTLYYHLNILEKFKLIKSSKFGRYKVFYSDSRGNGPYICGTAKKILEYVRDNPGSTARDIAASLHVSSSTVSHHLKSLEENGLIHIDRKSREIRVMARRT